MRESCEQANESLAKVRPEDAKIPRLLEMILSQTGQNEAASHHTIVDAVERSPKTCTS